MKVDMKVRPADLAKPIRRVFELAAAKVRSIDRNWDSAKGTPVFTVQGKYTTRGWTEWTQGFMYGCPILVFDATGDRKLLEMGRSSTLKFMAPHVTHVGVHDHGFNNLSSYGNLRRLMREGRVKHDAWEMNFYDMAIKCSGAVQAARWSEAPGGLGYVYSFNGPHSLFVDTIRSMRILGLAHQLGHVLMGECDKRISLLNRSVRHGLSTAKWCVWYGEGRDHYDVRGRTAHEAIFNRNDGNFRCPSSQQGYSPFTTWTRGQSWAICGFAEELEFFKGLDAAQFKAAGLPAKAEVVKAYVKAARATCDFYINDGTSLDGVCYWDTGAPGMAKFDWQNTDADPFNEYEPVDSTASAISAQGLIRLGNYLGGAAGRKYVQAGLTVARTLFDEPYLSTKSNHQGLLLHSVYHWPNGWDYVPPGMNIPCGESSMWGDYHLLELANLIKRMAEKGPYPTFFDQK
ncbi:MAG: Unsaturated chondroitin disaccharide hydrolase [Phycisphaerae bacterium]|nr:Unsaturated chondroitin disaccharide hydrolase [Phycisphaerae bacterium]